MAKIPVKYRSLDPIVMGEPKELEGDFPAVPLREKWVAQVEHTVKELHRHGVVWVDAKPGNVVVDMDDNAWVIDFRGGGTAGWTLNDLLETRRGTCMPLQK